mmetsp:Transcript_67072/g.187620  ORF Transcript_67072/g.187620 Transcript_67072/m.187620 type:complete len:286 (+) Transcript_67072:812-1669(+)
MSEARLAVAGHHALAGERAHGGAEVDVGPHAELAAAAVGLVARDDVVAGGELRDALADALHDARRLMAEDAGEEALGVQAVEGVGVGVAERDGVVLDADLTLLGRPHHDLHEGQGLLRLEGDGGQALDLLPRCVRGAGACGIRVDRGRRRRARIGAPPQQPGELGGVVLEVVLDVRRDEEVGVVVALAHAQRQHDALLRAGLLERLGLELLAEEVVGGALVHEEALRGALVLLHELDRVIGLPSLLVVAQVQGQRLLAPGHLCGVHDRGEGGHRLVEPGVLQRDG